MVAMTGIGDLMNGAETDSDRLVDTETVIHFLKVIRLYTKEKKAMKYDPKAMKNYTSAQEGFAEHYNATPP
jgi:hypothetical protein